jgi:acyl carrier protein
MTTTRTRLLATITTELGAIVTTADDVLDAVILRDLRPDSLDVITTSMAIEDEFGISMDEPEIMALGEGATLRDLLALVEGKLAGKVMA